MGGDTVTQMMQERDEVELLEGIESDDSELAAAIDDYDRRQNARHAIPRDQQRANAAFGEAAFYGWSEDKVRQAAEAEGAAFPPYLRSHGFSFD